MMLQPEPRQPGSDTVPVPTVGGASAAPGDQQPICFLLLRQKSGELPWLVRAPFAYMAPAQVVPVIGMANALWRLGRERFDAVLPARHRGQRRRPARALSRAHRRCRLGARAAPSIRHRAGAEGRAATCARASGVQQGCHTGRPTWRSRACPGSGARSAKRVRQSRRRPPSPERAVPRDVASRAAHAGPGATLTRRSRAGTTTRVNARRGGAAWRPGRP